MKKQKIRYIVISIAVIVIIVAIVLGVMFLSENKEESTAQDVKGVLVKEYCWSKVVQYDIEETEEDGMATVTVLAPDFCQIATVLMNEGRDITEEALIDAMLNTSADTKTYSIMVEDTTEETVKEAFYEQVAYELMLEAIKNIEYTEEWSDEE